MQGIPVFNRSVIELGWHQNRAGNFSFVESSSDLSFKVKRVFYIFDIPGDEDRGAHVHKAYHQFTVSVSGSFEIELNDGINKRTLP